ncbi:hypothetical protein BN2364_1004 [Alloalcanivorax xenomutans]|nr:hypothetical protein BN2364_1004 [Alloalcanivorax xenomutans]
MLMVRKAATLQILKTMILFCSESWVTNGGPLLFLYQTYVAS